MVAVWAYAVHGLAFLQQAFGELYRYLIEEKKYPDHQARHAVSRRIATIALGVLKSGEKFEPHRKRQDVNINKTAS